MLRRENIFDARKSFDHFRTNHELKPNEDKSKHCIENGCASPREINRSHSIVQREQRT